MANHCHWTSRVDFCGHFNEQFCGFAMSSVTLSLDTRTPVPSLQTRRASAMSNFLSFLWEVVLTTCTASLKGSALPTAQPICSVMVPLPFHRVKVERAFGHLHVKWWALLSKQSQCSWPCTNCRHLRCPAQPL